MTTPRQNILYIMPSQTRNNKYQEDGRQHHTANLNHRGRGWHFNGGSQQETTKTRGIKTQVRAETMDKPEVRAINSHTRRIRLAREKHSNTVGQGARSPRQQKQTKFGYYTDKDQPGGEKRPNKTHENTRVSQNYGQNRSYNLRWPYKKNQQIQRTTDPQWWTGHYQGSNRKRRPQTATTTTRAIQEYKKK